jgi:hypothetical protein
MMSRHLLRFLLALALTATGQARAVDPEQRLVWREQAQRLEHGEGVKRDIEAAIRLYCQAALAGDGRSAYRLGWIYAHGRGVSRNDGFASHWFARGALLGDTHAEAMFKLVAAPADKPECVEQAERSEREKASEEQQAAEAAALATRYRDLVDTPEERRIMKIVYKLAPQFGIQPGLAFAVIRAESNFNVNALSSKNAQGLMQLIPETAQRFGVSKPFDAEQNIRGGLSYLRWLLSYFRGDVALALAAYNAGEGAVDRFRGVPPYPETQGYIKRIAQVYALQHHPFDERITPPSPVLLARLP